MNVGPAPRITREKLTPKYQAVAYYRASSAEEDYQRTDQDRAIRERLKVAAEDRYLTISAYACDQPGNGQLVERPGFMLGLARIKAGLADTLIVDSVANLTRDAQQLAGLCYFIIEKAKRLIIVEEGIDTDTSRGQLIALITAGIDNDVAKTLNKLAIEGEI